MVIYVLKYIFTQIVCLNYPMNTFATSTCALVSVIWQYIACLFKRNPEHPNAETLIINLWLLIAVDCILISILTLKGAQIEGKRNSASPNLHTCHVPVQWPIHSLHYDNTFHINFYHLGNSFVAHWQVCTWSWQNQGHSKTGLDECPYIFWEIHHSL